MSTSPPDQRGPPAASVAPSDANRNDDLRRALLKGLGVPDLPLPHGLDAALMESLGRVLREMTQGTLDMLRLRSEAKSSIHADMTIIGPREVNPLKAAWDADVALRHLLAPQRADLLGPVQAVTDAYDDLRAHDRGLAAGIDAALSGLLERFSPAKFEERLQGGNALERLLPASRKARQWDLLVELYEDIAEDAQQDFWTVFEREFRRAYRVGQDAAAGPG